MAWLMGISDDGYEDALFSALVGREVRVSGRSAQLWFSLDVRSYNRRTRIMNVRQPLAITGMDMRVKERVSDMHMYQHQYMVWSCSENSYLAVRADQAEEVLHAIKKKDTGAA